MKNIIKRAALVLALLCTAAFAMKEAVINKLLALKMKEFITPAYITKVAKAHTLNFGGGGKIGFNEPYYTCRDKAYDDLGIRDNEGDGEEGWLNYVRTSTVAVSFFKKELHSGDTLREVYDQCREEFRKNLSAQPKDFQDGMLKLLERAKLVFNAIENEEYRKAVQSLLDNGDHEGDGNKYQEAFELRIQCDKLLAQNLGPEEILKLLRKPAAKLVTAKVAGQEDFGLVKFAFRRWNEGGIELVKKYQIVIDLAIADVELAKQQPGQVIQK